MRPVDQTVTAAPGRTDGHDADGTPGDCLRACVASLLVLPLDAVPHFIANAEHAEHADAWWDELRDFVFDWSGGRWRAECFTPEARFTGDPTADVWPRHFIATGASPRGPWQHCVLVDGWTLALAHDPHPSRAGLAGEPVDLISLLATGA